MGKRSADGLVLSQSMEKPLSKWKKTVCVTPTE